MNFETLRALRCYTKYLDLEIHMYKIFYLYMECFDVDGETSDEEYIQDEEAAKADSDVCSDIDDDEAEKAEHEADQSTNQEPGDLSDNDGDIDSDHDDNIDTKNMVPQSQKRMITARRVLDSDSEDENEVEHPKNGPSESLCKAESSSENLCALSTISDNTVYSAVLFEDTRDCNESTTNPTAWKKELKSHPIKKGGPRRSSTLGGDLEEASMPPLMLNDSMQSDESSESSFADKAEPDGEIKADSTAPAIIDEDLGLHSEETRPPFSTQPIEEEEERDVGGGEQDNSSLELSLLWQPSMPPPAQVRKDSSEELLPATKVSVSVLMDYTY